MKYYARINKTQIGPLTLPELLKAGLRPENFVWCKGMADWQRAEDQPDICRAMRRVLAGLDPETGKDLRAVASDAGASGSPAKFDPTRPPQTRQEMTEYLREAFEEAERNSRPDYSYPPAGVSVVMAVAMTLLCFPFTGIVAIYYAYRCKSQWGRSLRTDLSESEREECRRRSHDAARIYRMMVGITFCIGVIMVGMTLSKTLF